MGEVAFIDKYRDAFLTDLIENPMDFLRKCANRVLHMFLLYPEYSPRPEPPTFQANLKYCLKAGLYWIPFAVAIFLILNPGTRSKKTIQVGIVIYFAYLAPYVLVGFYNRYRIPLLPVFTVLYFQFLSSLLELRRNKKRSYQNEDEKGEWLLE